LQGKTTNELLLTHGLVFELLLYSNWFQITAHLAITNRLHTSTAMTAPQHLDIDKLESGGNCKSSTEESTETIYHWEEQTSISEETSPQ
jgi:hypothetical protein